MAVNRIAHLFTSYLPPAPTDMPEKVLFAARIPEELHSDLVHFHEASGISYTRIMEDAVRLYLRTKHWADMEGEDDSPAERRKKGK